MSLPPCAISLHYLATTLVTSARTYSYNERLAKFQRSKFVDNSKVSLDGYLQFLKKGNSVLLKTESEVEGYDVQECFCSNSMISALVGMASIEPNFVHANAPAADANSTAL